jgi:hypothetical protein
MIRRAGGVAPVLIDHEAHHGDQEGSTIQNLSGRLVTRAA